MAAPYKVSYLAPVLADLRAMAARAVARGLRSELAAALTAVNTRLTQDPVGWGDPLRRMKSGTRIFGRAIATLYFTYAVRELDRVVFVHRVVAFTASPFAADEPTS